MADAEAGDSVPATLGDPGDAAGAAGSPSVLERPAGELVPAWLVNFAELGWRILAVAGLLVVAWFVATLLWTVTASIAVAVVISAVFAPMVLRLRARGRSRSAAAGIVWATAILVVGGVLLLLALLFLPNLVELAQSIASGLDALREQLAKLGVPDWVATLANDALDTASDSAGATAGGIVAAAAQAVTILILATFLIYFFLKDGDKAWVWAFQAAGAEKRERITSAGDDALQRVAGYLRGTTLLSGLLALTNLVFMWILGVPLALPLALLTFLCGFIPYFGGIVVTIVILLVSLSALGMGTTLVLLVLMSIRTFLLGYGVRPTVYGRTVSIHPALVLIALPAGFALAGVVGIFAAVPVTAVVLAVASAAVAIVGPDPHPPLPELVPAWLDRLAQFAWRILVGFALLVLCVLILTTVPLVVIPVVIGIILAASLEPLVQALVRRGRSRSAAAGIAVGGGLVLIVVLVALSLRSVFEQVQLVGDSVVAGANTIDDAAGGHLGLPAAGVADGARTAVQTVLALAEATASLAAVLLLGTLLGFYFLRDGGMLWGRLMARVRPDVGREVDAAGRRAFDVLGGYMIGTAAISFVGAASQWLIMVLLGLPLALPIFVLSFILCFIPYIGGFLSTGIAFLVAVAAGSPADVAIMGIWTIVFNLVQGNVVSPLVYGRTVHVHPAIVLVAIPAGAAVAGILGMFIIVPAIGVVAATWRTVLGVIGSHSARPAFEGEGLVAGATPGD